MPTIQYPKHPNTDTAFVIQDDGKKNRALMIAPQDITSLELPENPNSTKGYVTVNGKKQRVVLTADISGSGGGGGGAVTSVNGKTGDVVLTAKDVDALAQFDTMPTASATEEGNIYQYIGTTDANYTNGYFYKCVSDGQNPATYSWSNIQVQASSGGLPSQTGNAGKFLTTDGTDASWSDKPLVNTATTGITIKGNSGTYGGINIGTNSTAGNYYTIAMGDNANSYKQGGIAVGFSSRTNGNNAIAIGYTAWSEANYAIQIGFGTNSTANTLSIGLSNSNNYRLLDSDGTVPTARLTKVNSTITLAAADWSSSTQTVSVTGMTATGVVLVSPDPTDQADYTSAGIYCSAQAAGTLTFTCDSVPASDLTVSVIML